MKASSLVERLSKDIKKLSNSDVLSSVSKHLNQYEKVVRELIHSVDVTSKEAREKRRERVEDFVQQVKKTRSKIEKSVAELLNQESRRLNDRFSGLLKYLKTVSNGEKVKSVRSPKKKAPRKKNGSSKGRPKKVSVAPGTKRSEVLSGSSLSSSMGNSPPA